MKRPTEQLLDDVLAEAAPPGFRAALLDRTLRQARRRKQIRRWNLALSAAAGVALLTFAFWNAREPRTASTPARRPDLVIVHSRPLNPAQVVSTRPGAVQMVSSSASTFRLVQTRMERLYEEIDDQQLLALVSGKPVALIHRGPNQAELIFLNREDEKGVHLQ